MSGELHLFPGSALPLWVESLEQTVFGEPWGALEDHEVLFGLPPQAYARWSAVPAAQEAELLRIAVAPTARRQGLARRLLEASESWLRSEGIQDLYLEVRPSNQPAQALYEVMGWQQQRLRKAYYRDGEDALVYWKQLEA